MTKKRVYISLGVIVVALAVVWGISKSGKFGDKKEGKAVEIATVKTATIVETVSATGKIQPEIEIKIASEVSGEIIELPVKEGQVVKKGDLLAKVNPDLLMAGYNRTVAGLSQTKASLSQADAQFNEAKANFDRSKTLFDKGIISRADWDRSISQFEVAKAAKQASYYNVASASATVKEAKDNLGRTTIYAPESGTISKLDVELGERVLGTQQMAGTEMMRVANLNNMEVEVDVNENDIVKISIGDSAKVAVDAYLKKEFKGVVTSISNSASTALTADQVTNFKVKIRIVKNSYADLLEGKPSSYSPFRPGMTATVDIATTTKVNVLNIPISAVVVKSDTLPSKPMKESGDEKKEQQLPKSDKKLECVFVKNGGKATIRIIKTGIQDDTNIEVLSGLKQGDVIITGPYSLVSKELNSGDKVFVEEVGKKK